MARDIFDEVAPDVGAGDIFDEIAPETTRDIFDEVAPEPAPKPELWQDPAVLDQLNQAGRLQQGFQQMTSGDKNLLTAIATDLAPKEPTPQEIREQEFAKRAGVTPIPLGTRVAAGVHTGLQQAAMWPRIINALMVSGLDTVGLGNTTLAQQNRAVLEGYAGKEADIARRDQATFGDDIAQQLASGTGRAVAELPLYLGPGAVAKTPQAALKVASAAGGVMGGGTQLSQDLGAGMGTGEALPYAVASGLITALTTRAFGATGAESVFRQEGIQGIRARLLDVLKQSGLEGAEEAADQMQQDILERWQRNPDKPIDATIKEVLMAGAIGGIVGGGVSGVGNAVGGAQDMAADQAQVEQASKAAFDQARGVTPAADQGEKLDLDYINRQLEQEFDARAENQPAGDIFDEVASEAQPQGLQTESAQTSRPVAAGAPPVAPDASQQARVRAELEQLPGDAAAEGRGEVISKQTGEVAQADNVPATKADLKALAEFIEKGGPNPFAQPAEALPQKGAEGAKGDVFDQVAPETGKQMPAGAAVTTEGTAGAPIPTSGQEATTVNPPAQPVNTAELEQRKTAAWQQLQQARKRARKSPQNQPAQVALQQAQKAHAAAVRAWKKGTGQAIATGTRASKVMANEESMGGADILTFIMESGGLVSKSVAKRKRGTEWWRLNASLYDDAGPLARPHHNVIYSENGSYPDQLAQAAYEQGLIDEPHERALWAAIKAASETRGKAYQQQRAQNEQLETEAKFAMATADGELQVRAEDLEVGDTFEVDGEAFRVARVDKARGTVTLQDGKVFGRQTLIEGQEIWVEQPSDGLVERIADGAQFAAGDNEENPLAGITQAQFDRKYSIHFDVRDGAESRVEAIMRDGLKSGMVSSDIDNKTPETIFAKNAHARGWARYAGADKPGAIAYVIRNSDFNQDSLRIKPGTKPVAVVRLTRENQSVYEALQEGNAQFAAGEDLFGAPESVEEQRERLRQEKQKAESRKQKEQMQDRAGARLISTEDTRTEDMFGGVEGRTTRQDKTGQGSLFAAGEQTRKRDWRKPYQMLGEFAGDAEYQQLHNGLYADRGDVTVSLVSAGTGSDYLTMTENSTGETVKIRFADHFAPGGGGFRVNEYGSGRSGPPDFNIVKNKIYSLENGKWEQITMEKLRWHLENWLPAKSENANAPVAGGAAGIKTPLETQPQRAEAQADKSNVSALRPEEGSSLTSETPPQTGKGVNSQFSQGARPAKGLPIRQVQNVVAGLQREMPKALPTTVVATAEDLPITVRTAAQKQGVRLAGVKGTVIGGRVYLVAQNLAAPAEAQSIWLHEQVGHFATDAELGSQLRAFMGQVHDSFQDSKLMADIRARYPQADKITLGREVVARLAEGGDPNPGAFRRLLALFRAWLRKMGLVRQVSENDLRVMLQRAADSLRETTADERGSTQMGRGQNGVLEAGNATLVAPWARADYALTAHHGTPHKVDKFTTEKIGTGEGAQVYGWGLYFAENPAVAEDYAKTLADRAGRGGKPQRLTLDGVDYGELSGSLNSDEESAWFELDQRQRWWNPDKVDPLARVEQELTKTVENYQQVRAKMKAGRGIAEQGLTERDMQAFLTAEHTLKWLKKNRRRIAVKKAEAGGGNKYTVELNVEPEDLLDWDKPLSEQSEKVKAEIKPILDDIVNRQSDYRKASELSRKYQDFDLETHGSEFYTEIAKGVFGSGVRSEETARRVSESLSKAGIKGIRYLDQGSRRTSGGEIVSVYEEGGKWFARVKVTNRGGIGFTTPTDAFTTSKPYDSEQAARDWANEQINRGTYNYVIFDEKDIAITHENGQPVSVTEAVPGQAEFAAGAEARNLVAVHNTRAEGLMHALKMGGLAVPSIAIVRADKAVLEGFGDITLVGTPDLVTPSKDTKVLNADAYSPRYPNVKVIISDRDGRKVVNAFREYLADLPAEAGAGYQWQPANILEAITERGWRELKYNSLARYAYLRDNGLMPAPAAGTDYDTFRNEVERLAQGREEAIPAWAELKIKNLGVDAQDKIFKGYTYSGKKSYTPHTLENVVKIMKKGFADAEGFNYGVGSVRAKTGKQFRNLKGIQQDRDKIIPKAQMEALKSEVDQEFGDLHDYAMPYRQGGKNSGFGTMDAFSDDLKAMAEGGSANFQHLREMYPGGEPFAKMREFLAKLRNLPTEYFEAKPRRAVQLQEFAGAVVPEGTNPDLISQLERRGLEVKTYPKGNQEARRAAVEAIGQEREALFAAGPAAESEFGRLQGEVAAAEAALMTAIRQHMNPPEGMSKAQALAAKDTAAQRLHQLLAKQLKLMTDPRQLDIARSPEETAKLIAETVDLLNAIQDDITQRATRGQEIPPDVARLRVDLQERLRMLKGWTEDQQDAASRGAKVERQPARDDRFLELESASDPEQNTLPAWKQKLVQALRYFTSPIPELPLTGPRAASSALFRRGYRLFEVENNRVRKEAAERVKNVIAPLADLGRQPADNVPLQRYYQLHNQLKRAEMDPDARAAIKKQMRELEEKHLNKDPFNLFRRLVLYKDLAWRATYLKNDAGKPITLPLGLTVEDVQAELARVYAAIEAHPDGLAITEALRRHYALTDELQKSILEHGEIIPESLRNPLYFPHHIQDNWTGRLDRVRPKTEEDFRRYLIAPTGSAKLIQTDYLKAMYLHTADVLAHNARVDLVKKYWQPYDISEQLKAQHGEAWTMPWNMPPGYKLFAPFTKLPLRMDYILSREVLADKLGVLFNDGDLRARMGEAGKVIKVKPEDLHQALVAGEKIQWALPEEIVAALNGIEKREKAAANPGLGHAIGAPFRGLNTFWKKTKLFAPWNWIRYEYGNLSTDAIDKVLAADPAAAKYLPRAARELWESSEPGAETTPEFKAAAREGVFDTITAAEAGELTRQPEFKAFLTPGEARWSKVRDFLERPMQGSKFREGTFRYAKFLADVERLRRGEHPVYAGAFHRDIEALGEDVDGQRRMLDGEELIYAKAAEISLKTYGDYAQLGVAGQWLRTYAVPFWSWQDVNFRYHANQIRNLADGLLGQAGPDITSARKAALRYAGVRVASTLVAIGIAKELWNQFGGAMLGLWGDDDDLEANLSEADRRRGHLLLGKDENGKTLVVYTPSAWSDVAEWIGGQNMKRLFMEWARGQITLEQWIGDYAKQLPGDVLNKAAQSVGPLFKAPYELASGRATFPDVLDQRSIPDAEKWWRLVGTLTDDRAVNTLRGVFDADYYSQPAKEQLQQIILQIRRRDPEQWAYYEAREDASDWKEQRTGKRYEAGSYNAPEAQALRNFRRAIYRGDVEAAERFYTRLLDYGYTAERLDASIRSQHPLSDLNQEERAAYKATLTERQRRELELAEAYYSRIKTLDRREKQLFPSKRKPNQPANPALLRQIVEGQKNNSK